MKRWLLMLQAVMVLLITWQAWSIRNCERFAEFTYYEDCAGYYYPAGCGIWCKVGKRIDSEAYTCCCSTTTRNGENACCEGQCVRWECITLITEDPCSNPSFDVQFMGVRGELNKCEHTFGGGSKDMEGSCGPDPKDDDGIDAPQPQ